MPPCTPGTDTDKDSVDDCAEAGDGLPFTDPAKFNGLHVLLGDDPFWSGNCDHMSDYTEMESRFDTPEMELDAYAGWSFDTEKDKVNDREFGFQPNWPKAPSGVNFSLRYRGAIWLSAGPHCFQIDIGATTTQIGNNRCGQLYLGLTGTPTTALAETGYGARADDAHTKCVDVLTDGAYPFDIVFWYYNVLQQAKLAVRHCAGAACTPTEGIPATMVQAQR